MALQTVTATAAVAIVGKDLLVETTWKTSSRARVLKGVGFTGSAAIGDSAVDFYVGNLKLASLFNSKLLVGNKDDIQQVGRAGVVVPGGEPLSMIVTDAAATSPVFGLVDID